MSKLSITETYVVAGCGAAAVIISTALIVYLLKRWHVCCFSEEERHSFHHYQVGYDSLPDNYRSPISKNSEVTLGKAAQLVQNQYSNNSRRNSRSQENATPDTTSSQPDDVPYSNNNQQGQPPSINSYGGKLAAPRNTNATTKRKNTIPSADEDLENFLSNLVDGMEKRGAPQKSPQRPPPAPNTQKNQHLSSNQNSSNFNTQFASGQQHDTLNRLVMPPNQMAQRDYNPSPIGSNVPDDGSTIRPNMITSGPFATSSNGLFMARATPNLYEADELHELSADKVLEIRRWLYEIAHAMSGLSLDAWEPAVIEVVWIAPTALLTSQGSTASLSAFSDYYFAHQQSSLPKSPKIAWKMNGHTVGSPTMVLPATSSQ